MPLEATGMTIAFQSGILAEILDVQRTGRARTAIPTSHFGTVGAKTYMPAKNHDGGQWVVQIHADPLNDVQAAMVAAEETVTLVWPDAGATNEVAQGFLVGHDTGAPFEDRATETWTIQITGDTTITP